jgi:hypothetical protein
MSRHDLPPNTRPSRDVAPLRAASRLGLAALFAIGFHFSQAARAEPAGARATPVAARNENDKRVTFVLRAMNTSPERPSIDVEIAVDGAVVVRDRLSSEGSKEISIPPSKAFPLILSRGKHTLRARSSEANAAIERKIEIRKKLWGLLSYEPGPDKKYAFTLTLQETPIYFQ